MQAIVGVSRDPQIFRLTQSHLQSCWPKENLATSVLD
jgi:hypothetical protein